MARIGLIQWDFPAFHMFIYWYLLLCYFTGGLCGGFKCRLSGHCIHNSMKCNNLPNCGSEDDSDEASSCKFLSLPENICRTKVTLISSPSNFEFLYGDYALTNITFVIQAFTIFSWCASSTFGLWHVETSIVPITYHTQTWKSWNWKWCNLNEVCSEMFKTFLLYGKLQVIFISL